jgi:hypothetical protein
MNLERDAGEGAGYPLLYKPNYKARGISIRPLAPEALRQSCPATTAEGVALADDLPSTLSMHHFSSRRVHEVQALPR